MENADKVDCNDITNTSADERICLNLKFQHIDSVMNYRIDTLISNLDSDSKAALIEEQESWIIKRRETSREESDGFNGHTLGIIYLETMISMTEERMKELGIE